MDWVLRRTVTFTQVYVVDGVLYGLGVDGAVYERIVDQYDGEKRWKPISMEVC